MAEEEVSRQPLQPALAAFGNPLLDIIVSDEAGQLVQQFGLAREVAQEFDTVGTGLFAQAMGREDAEYAGGGCALNTARVFQWLQAGRPGQTVFLGGLGRDKSGDLLEQLVRESGVNTLFARHPDLATGHCVALVRGSERTLAAQLGAAARYEAAELAGHSELLQQAKVIYVEGYFLAHSPATTLDLAAFAHKHKITFVFNLCGEYVCEDIEYVQNVLKLLPYIDIMFGNRSEFDVFINTVEAKLETSSSLIRNLRAMITGEGVEKLEVKIENICESPVRRQQRSLLVVVTEGCQPVQCYRIGPQHSSSLSVPVPALPHNLVKDTIGAGDSFIAGFLHVFTRNGSLKSCIEYAIWTAQKMIQQVGVTLPTEAPERHLVEMKKKERSKRNSCSQDSSSCGINIERKKIKS